MVDESQSVVCGGGDGGGVSESHGVVVLVGDGVGGEGGGLTWFTCGGGVVESQGVVEIDGANCGGGRRGGVEAGGGGDISQGVLVSGGGLSTSLAGLVESHGVLVGGTTLLQSGTGISSSVLTSMILIPLALSSKCGKYFAHANAVSSD